MVMDLPRPTACSLALLDAVIAERQGGANAAFFNGLASEWRERVRAYIERAGSPEFVPRWPQIEPRKRTFLNLYLSRQKGYAQAILIPAMLHGPALQDRKRGGLGKSVSGRLVYGWCVHIQKKKKHQSTR